MSSEVVSDAVLKAYLTQARRDLAQGVADSIAIPARSMAALLDECVRARAEGLLLERAIRRAERIAEDREQLNQIIDDARERYPGQLADAWERGAKSGSRVMRTESNDAVPSQEWLDANNPWRGGATLEDEELVQARTVRQYVADWRRARGIDEDAR